LGHTRLSIIDLSTSADQPMRSSDGRYTIIFNGEIYNFQALRKEILDHDPSRKFQTQSDTEVILEGFVLWGPSICKKLEGMFAFAIYDENKNELFLCRDRLGKKPLFYFRGKSEFIFASEIKALLKHPMAGSMREIDYQALYTFLHLGYIPEPLSVYKGIKKFPAGHYAFVSENKFEITPFWKIENSFPVRTHLNTSEAIKTLHATLITAVEKRMISDVPLGAFLSGGTDSSLVVAIASKLKKDKLKTFTIGFDENKFNESHYASRVASHLRTDHHTYILKESEALDLLEKYLKHFDEPFADTSAIPTMLVSKLARKEVTVALTGDGGDEFFLGYGSYDWANRLDQPFMKMIANPLSTLFKNFGNDRLKRISFLLQKVAPKNKRSHIFSQEQYFFTQDEIQNELLPGQRKWELNYDDPNLPWLTEGEKQALFDIQYYLKDDLLVKVDRASMYTGLECRSPLLDQNVAALGLSLPPALKRSPHKRKWILKEILGEYLPNDLVNRPKWGFSVPLERWMRNDLQYLINNFLNEEIVQSIGLVNYAFVDKLKSRFLKGENYLYNRLWVLIVVHKWLYENSSI
jgi:asparagine synthase (glutamine-hydrolysing)